MLEPLKTRDEFEVFWKISTRGFYGHFMDSFCFKAINFILWRYEKAWLHYFHKKMQKISHVTTVRKWRN